MDYSLRINGKSYPARFTLRVAIRAAERRGSIKALFQNDNQGERVEDMGWLAAEMIRAGAKLKEREDGEKAELLSCDEILDSVDAVDLLELQAQMLTVINRDEPTVRAEGDGKNAEATSDR